MPQELHPAAAAPLHSHRSEEIRTQSKSVFAITPTKGVRTAPDLRDLLRRKGDPVSGQKVFAKQGKCADCHQVQNQGQAVGPDLSQIGTKLARPALFESILYPSAAISHNYESYSAVLHNGKIITGVLVNQNDLQIQLRDADGNLRSFKRADVESFVRQSVSLMPANLHEAMTVQELVDVVAYLTTLKDPQKGP